jgi:hypothetical protein
MEFKELITTYWYVVAILIFVILIWIYMKQDSYTRSKIKRFFSGPVLGIMFLVLVWIIIAKFGPTVNTKLAHIMMPPLILVGVCLIVFLGTLRYWSPQFITPNFHGSYSSAWPREVNGFLIYGIDSFNAGGLCIDTAKRVAVVRKETCEMFLKGSLSIANMSKVHLYSLPDEVVEEIQKNNHLKDAKEIYYGWFDDLKEVDWTFNQLRRLSDEKSSIRTLYNMLKKELKVNNPKVSTLFFNYMNQSKTLNKLREYYHMTIDNTDTGVEHMKRIRDAYTQPTNNQPNQMSQGSEEQY